MTDLRLPADDLPTASIELQILQTAALRRLAYGDDLSLASDDEQRVREMLLASQAKRQQGRDRAD